MGEEDKEQRTEEPTEKKRQDTFEKGQTATSREVNSTLVLFASVTFLYAFGGMMRENISEVFTNGFTVFTQRELTVSTLRPMALYYLKMMAIILSPVMIGAAVAGILGNIAQNGGIILSANPITPKFNKLNPIKGVGKLFSKQSLMELFKSIGKIAIVSSVAFWVIRSEWENIPNLSGQNEEQVMAFIAWVAFKLMLGVLTIMIILAIIDYVFVRYQFEESLKMTKQEIKDERKTQEGDPIVKQRIRSTQMQMARRRMMQEVPKADVVITNPTHLAIAISYDRWSMDAPRVIAKGAGRVAEKIKEVAKENEVPVVEDKPLARILFKTVGIDESIPEELFRAIAEILAYVYRLKDKSF